MWWVQTTGRIGGPERNFSMEIHQNYLTADVPISSANRPVFGRPVEEDWAAAKLRKYECHVAVIAPTSATPRTSVDVRPNSIDDAPVATTSHCSYQVRTLWCSGHCSFASSELDLTSVQLEVEHWCLRMLEEGHCADFVQNAFWGVVTNPSGQHTVLGAPTGLKPPIWQFTPWTRVFCT